MQQLKVEHNKKDRRTGKGRCIALSRRTYRLMQTDDVFYVESESTDNVYYYVKFKPDVLEWCSCMDNSTRHKKCKHIYSIEFAIRMGTLKDTDDRLPADTKRDTTNTIAQDGRSSSYEEDDYSF